MLFIFYCFTVPLAMLSSFALLRYRHLTPMPFCCTVLRSFFIGVTPRPIGGRVQYLRSCKNAFWIEIFTLALSSPFVLHFLLIKNPCTTALFAPRSLCISACPVPLHRCTPLLTRLHLCVPHTPLARIAAFRTAARSLLSHIFAHSCLFVLPDTPARSC